MAPTLGVLARALVTVLLTGCLASPPAATDGDDPADGGVSTPIRRLGGPYHAHCAIRGGGALFCWGAGGAGQLGDDGGVDRASPVAAVDADLEPLSGVLAMTGSNTHSCAIRADRTVNCWGRNNDGQLGDGSKTNTLRAKTGVIGLSDASLVSAFGEHTCATDLSGAVRCWGRNEEGELGDGTATTGGVVEPVDMLDGSGAIRDALDLASGNSHTCVVRSDRRVWCTGLNAHGQLGRHAGEAFECERNLPRPLEIGPGEYLEDASLVAAGVLQSCAIADDIALCWGDPRCGQIGSGDAQTCLAPSAERCDDEGSYPPTAVALGDLAPCAPLQLGAGEDFSCLLCAEGHIGCWGDGARGKLGNGADLPSSVAVRVDGIESAVELLVGFRSSCALLATGEVVCWGEGSEGQLGNGSIGLDVFSTRPVPVIGLPP